MSKTGNTNEYITSRKLPLPHFPVLLSRVNILEVFWWWESRRHCVLSDLPHKHVLLPYFLRENFLSFCYSGQFQGVRFTHQKSRFVQMFLMMQFSDCLFSVVGNKNRGTPGCEFNRFSKNVWDDQAVNVLKHKIKLK